MKTLKKTITILLLLFISVSCTKTEEDEEVQNESELLIQGVGILETGLSKMPVVLRHENGEGIAAMDLDENGELDTVIFSNQTDFLLANLDEGSRLPNRLTTSDNTVFLLSYKNNFTVLDIGIIQENNQVAYVRDVPINLAQRFEGRITGGGLELVELVIGVVGITLGTVGCVTAGAAAVTSAGLAIPVALAACSSLVVSVASFIDENSDSQNIISNQLDNANGIYSYLANTIGCQVGNAPACYSLLLDASSYIINETSTIWTTIGEGNIALVEGALFTGFGDVKVTLVWDTTSDIDLWVTDPFGETITYQNTTSQSGGFLDVDDVDGYGPENIFWATEAPAGSYTVQAHYYGDNGEGATNYTIQVQLGTEVQTFNGRLESEDDLNTVVNFNYANGKQHVEFFTSTEVTKITAPKNK